MADPEVIRGGWVIHFPAVVYTDSATIRNG